MTIGPEPIIRIEQQQLNPGQYFSEVSASVPDVFTFFFDSDTRLLSEDEHDYLLFVGMIILKTADALSVNLADIDLDDLESRAEDNWGLLEFTSIENLSSTLEASHVSELYFFLEDACTPANGHEVLSAAGVELVYVKCKSLIDLIK